MTLSDSAADISIIIPTFQRIHLLKRTLNAISKELTSVDINAEVIVTDDDLNLSSFGLKEFFTTFIFIEGRHQGLSENRSAGLAVARGQWVLFMDDDCWPSTGWLRAYTEAIYIYPNEVFFSGPVVEDKPRQRMDEEAPRLLGGELFYGCNFMILRSVLTEIGGFNNKFPFYLEDIELGIRLRKAGHRIFFLSKAAVIHPWRVLPSIKGKIREVLCYKQLILTYPEVACSFFPWVRFKIAVSKSLTFWSDLVHFQGRGARKAFIILIIEYSKVLVLGCTAITAWHGFKKNSKNTS